MPPSIQIRSWASFLHFTERILVFLCFSKQKKRQINKIYSEILLFFILYKTITFNNIQNIKNYIYMIWQHNHNHSFVKALGSFKLTNYFHDFASYFLNF